MQNNYPKSHGLTPFHFLKLKRVAQITWSHCGPATLQMLLSWVHVDVTQDEITQSANIHHKIEGWGTLIEELGKASQTLSPHTQFWFKHNASIEDAYKIIHEYGFPVGVEWQGVFDSEDKDDDDGHYAVITYIDLENNFLTVADPYIRYAGQDRTFSIPFFIDRWWDINEIKNDETGDISRKLDNKSLFIVVPREAHFPLQLGLERYNP